MKWLYGCRIRFVLIILCITFTSGALYGKPENGESDSIAISAAGPRLGPVQVVEVTFPDREALGELARAGYDISNVQGNVATIYASLDELDQLKKTGYPLREICEHTRQKGFGLMAVGGYHSYAALTDELSAYAEANPDICRLYTLGQSVEGRELWAMLITDNPGVEEDEPEFKYVSTIHGDEPVGTEMCLYFIDLLLTEYETDERITNLVDSTAIWIVPLMNPDGLESGTRANANGFNLNRNFPTVNYSSMNIYEGGPLDAETSQPEIQHVINWTAENSFVLSTTFHTGALLVRYPYDNDGKGSVDSPTSDDLLFEEISRRYSMWNLPMWNSTSYPQGIVNGAFMYPVDGGACDWHYRYVSCNEVAIELSNIKRPSASQIPNFWSDNKESMLSFLEAVHLGVRGLITDRGSGDPLWAEILVEGNSHPVFTDPQVGDYHRMLLPGTYNLVFDAPGFLPRVVRNIIVTDGLAVRVDVELLSPDFNRDGIINIKDLEILIEHWGQENPLVDIAPLSDGDGIVNEQDLELFMEYWKEEIPQMNMIIGMIAHWALDETEGMFAADSVGDNDAVVLGGIEWQPTGGQIDGALKLDGVSGYAIAGAALNPADSPFSIFMWINGGAPGQVIISQQFAFNWLAIDAEGNLMTELKSSDQLAEPLLSEKVITDGQWHRIGLIWDGSNRTLCVDGVVVAEDKQDGLESSEMGLNIGAGKMTQPGTYWSGLIDDIRIYNRVVTP